MATPVRNISSSDVSVGAPTKASNHNNLRADVLVALTEMDYGPTGSLPGSPSVSQMYLDTTDDIIYACLDGSTWQAIASAAVTVDNNGVTISPGGNDRFNFYRDSQTDGAPLIMGAFDNSSSNGRYISIGRNSNGSTPAAGALGLANLNGTVYYLWVDSTGTLRINTSLPTNATDTGGSPV